MTKTSFGGCPSVFGVVQGVDEDFDDVNVRTTSTIVNCTVAGRVSTFNLWRRSSTMKSPGVGDKLYLALVMVPRTMAAASFEDMDKLARPA
jgi:hypothetical protein